MLEQLAGGRSRGGVGLRQPLDHRAQVLRRTARHEHAASSAVVRPGTGRRVRAAGEEPVRVRGADVAEGQLARQ